MLRDGQTPLMQDLHETSIVHWTLELKSSLILVLLLVVPSGACSSTHSNALFTLGMCILGHPLQLRTVGRYSQRLLGNERKSVCVCGACM